MNFKHPRRSCKEGACSTVFFGLRRFLPGTWFLFPLGIEWFFTLIDKASGSLAHKLPNGSIVLFSTKHGQELFFLLETSYIFSKDNNILTEILNVTQFFKKHCSSKSKYHNETSFKHNAKYSKNCSSSKLVSESVISRNSVLVIARTNNLL